VPKNYHEAWLTAHPNRTREWLEERLRDGFDIHHIDGNHSNDDPSNLVLIEHRDHMMLHGGRTMGRLNGRGRPPDNLRRDRARYLHERGIKISEIARVVGVSRGTVFNYVRG